MVDLLQNKTEKPKRILDLFRAIRKNLRDLIVKNNKQHNLTESKLLLVSELKLTPFITLHELSDRLSLSKGTVSGIVSELEDQGIVIREIPKDNRRIVKLSLSSDYADTMNIGLEFFDKLIENANPEDIDCIIKGLEKFCELFESNQK
ncbi:MarR family transcriptional regulator [Desulfosporosinus sp. Sb-LF]|uniref:MarR family winged helix-turn-helix transcriptional regulator n=1 Tax=Desulfosporosinus sp. Sb-LF TaxID=2560027 RepID=UPI00107F699D|nr:MarR family transcriptional regulator [Desulfosporosinus sp. Sb-LF]TGE34485.1 MarR family transcriptional regulator [Desulfosporosinus sp. Sb-LF]